MSLDALHWVAMEAGDYTHGRVSWRAGTINTPGDCASPCSFTFAPALTTTPGIVLTLHDTNNSGASYSRLFDVTPSQLQWRMDSAATEIVNYLAFAPVN